jgi:hypothetical protein
VQHPLAGEGACCLSLLFPHLDDLQVDKIEDAGNAVLITARSRAAQAACHRCGLSSAQVNSRYRRLLQDRAVGGRPVMIDLEVRRFFCGDPERELRTFAEQVPAVTQRHQRRTPLLRSQLEAIALALAGRPGARLASALGTEVSRTTLGAAQASPHHTDHPFGRAGCAKVRQDDGLAGWQGWTLGPVRAGSASPAPPPGRGSGRISLAALGQSGLT